MRSQGQEGSEELGTTQRPRDEGMTDGGTSTSWSPLNKRGRAHSDPVSGHQFHRQSAREARQEGGHGDETPGDHPSSVPESGGL